MAKLIYQTDKWGNKDGSHYIEFQVNGRTLQIEVNDNVVHVIGGMFGETYECANSFYALLPGASCKTLQQYHEMVDGRFQSTVDRLSLPAQNGGTNNG